MAIAGKILLRAREEYTATANYEVLDWVRHNGKAYVCKKECQGIEPPNSTYWSLMVQDGTGTPIMKGATQYANGESGSVPTPLTTDREKFLRGDGTWSEVNLDAKANGRGITFEVRDGVPFLKYQYIDTVVEDIVANIYDNDPTNDVVGDSATDNIVSNIFDDDESNDEPSDASIDEIINGIYNR